MSSPSSRPPAGVPTSSGNTKYAIVAVVLLIGIGILVALRSFSSRPAPLPPLPSASVAQSAEPPPNPKLEDIPPPPPPEVTPEAGPAPRVAVSPNTGCESKCSGYSTPELQQALQVRGQQARRCYNQALAQDSTLKGRVSISVRVGPTGGVCSVGIASNDMGTPAVANCAANIFRSSMFPAPKGGCVEATIPLSFVSQVP
jgi:outer membrane biosynthesis protein TonB